MHASSVLMTKQSIMYMYQTHLLQTVIKLTFVANFGIIYMLDLNQFDWF